MSSTQTEIGDLEDQFVYDLEAVYDMEVKLVDALDEMAMNASNDNISEGFATHRDETRQHVERVEAAFEALRLEPNRRTNPVVDALIEETEEFDRRASDETLRDLHYLNAGMKTERIEVTTYEGLLLLADKAELDDDVTNPLEENLDEEEKTLKKLKGLSKGSDLKALWDKLTG